MPRVRLQFGLRFLFAAITASAIIVWGVYKAREMAASVTLASVIDSFNTRIESNPTLALGPTLTESEVLGAIKSQQGIFAPHPDAKAIVEYILRTKRLPRDAKFSIVKSQSRTPTGPDWCRFVNLDVVTRQNRHCSFAIRQVSGQ